METPKHQNMEAKVACQQSADARRTLADLGRELERLVSADAPLRTSDIRQRLAEALSTSLKVEETLRTLLRQTLDELAALHDPRTSQSPDLLHLQLHEAGPESLRRHYDQVAARLSELRAGRDLLPRWENLGAALESLQRWRVPHAVAGLQQLATVSQDELKRGNPAAASAFQQIEADLLWAEGLIKIFSVPTGERPAARPVLDFCRRFRWLEDTVDELLSRIERGEPLAGEPLAATTMTKEETPPCPVDVDAPAEHARLPQDDDVAGSAGHSIDGSGSTAGVPTVISSAPDKGTDQGSAGPLEKPAVLAPPHQTTGDAQDATIDDAPPPPPAAAAEQGQADSDRQTFAPPPPEVDQRTQPADDGNNAEPEHAAPRERTSADASAGPRRSSAIAPPPVLRLTADQWRSRILAAHVDSGPGLWDDLAAELILLGVDERKALIREVIERAADLPPSPETRKRLLAVLLMTLPSGDADHREFVALLARVALETGDGPTAYVAAASLGPGARSPHLPHPIIIEILTRDRGLLQWLAIQQLPKDLAEDDGLHAALLVGTVFLRSRMTCSADDDKRELSYRLLPWFVDQQSDRYPSFCRLLNLLMDESIDWNPPAASSGTATEWDDVVAELKEKMEVLARSAQPYQSPGGRATFSALKKNAWRILRWIEKGSAPEKTPRPALRLFTITSSVEDHLINLFDELRDEGIHDQEQILKGDRARLIHWFETLAPAVSNLIGADTDNGRAARARADAPTWESLENEQRRMVRASRLLGQAAERLLAQLRT